jgi:hypothetical protein
LLSYSKAQRHDRFEHSFSSIRAKTAELEPVKGLSKEWPFKDKAANNGATNSLFFVLPIDERSPHMCFAELKVFQGGRGGRVV